MFRGNMMKGFLKIFLMVIGSLVLILAIIIGCVAIFSGNYKKTSKEFVDSNVPKILTAWDYATFCQFAHPDLIKLISVDEYLNKILTPIGNQLGEFVEYVSSDGGTTITKTATENLIKAEYVSNVKFENGNAKITTKLIYQNEEWHITGININSDKLKLADE
jgi:hypothetical protein